jgi:hypothetical protein
VDDFTDPTTDEIVDLADADAVIESLARIDAVAAELRHSRDVLVRALCVLSGGAAGKTVRVEGRKRVAKLTFHGEGWNQADLKAVWDNFPAYRDRFLRLDKVAVNLTEFKKAVKTSGPPEFTECVNRLLGAARPSSRPPTVTIER